MVTENLNTDTEQLEVNRLLSNITDPEIPVLTIADLGILREVNIKGKNVEVVITPTYSGCPAMDMIAAHIRMELLSHGYTPIIRTVISPSWTTDWISEEGKAKLQAYGISPPGNSRETDSIVLCPQCSSANTKLISQFGSTACKSLYRCLDCLECFDHFKCH